MIEGQMSRYGAISKVLPLMAPNAKVFFVGASTLPSFNDFAANYPVDKDGGNRIFATIASALSDTNTVAARGDVILLLPGHTETVVGAAGIALNESGMSIIGLGNGAARATVTFTTAVGASFDITAANVLIQNVRFVAGFDNITAMNNVTATDVTFDNCEWIISNGTVGAAICILTAATADRLKVTNSRFVGPAINAGTTCAACIQHESGVDYTIKGNYFAGKMTQAVLNVATVLRGLIIENYFVIGTGTKAIAMAAASTPFISNNRMNVASGTTPIVAAAGFVAGNIYSAAAGVTSTGQTGSTATVSTL